MSLLEQDTFRPCAPTPGQSRFTLSSTFSAPYESAPSPSPARFIRHPPRSESHDIRQPIFPKSTPPLTPTFTTVTNNDHDLQTLDITDSPQNDAISKGLEDTDDVVNDVELQRLLTSEKHSQIFKSQSHLLSPKPSMSFTSTLVSHNPIPATRLFARNAPPLYLPKLDTYLASLPKPPFPGAETSSSSKARMFPPMDKLAKSSQSLEDMEMNSQIPPFWRNRKTLLGSAVSLVIGLTGSSAIATYYSLQGVVNTVQVFALILSTFVPVTGEDLANEWRTLFLGTIPNVLALNFASTLTQSLIFLVIFMIIATGLLYYFQRRARHCDRYNRLEGLQKRNKGKHWRIVVVTFSLTVIYLPMSIMAIHVLVWSDDLWVVPNPYVNATSFPPVVAPIGPTSEYRDPLDFCWTTTMKKDEINYAPVMIILSAIVVGMLSITFPIMLRRVIEHSVPRVDRFTELGRPRTKADMDVEYHRVLARDQNPFVFLYSGFRRGWGTYESTYLFAKLSTLVIVAVIDPDNCLFRSASRTVTPIVRQVLLLVCTSGFFLAQCLLGPFLDPINNASEWVSRMNYVSTCIVALLVALNVPGTNMLNSYVLYAIYIITYGLSFYFTIINLSPVRRLVKRLTRRIDFSIDVFSPRLAVSYLSPHVKRRIWQESITTLILTSPDCKIPSQQTMSFAQALDFEFPPYLLDFAGSPGERHVENLKILREIGSFEYRKAATLISGRDSKRYKSVEVEIQNHFIGPDSYWKDPVDEAAPGRFGCFGNAWFIPFPPTVVMRYDNGKLVVLRTLGQLEDYVAQNSSRKIQRKREVRMALRTLEGQTVRWPYRHISPVGTQFLCCCFRQRYNANTSVRYESCVLEIKRNGYLIWDKVQLGSGFQIQLRYDKNVVIDGDTIGLTEDFELTSSLARFLALNEDLIFSRLGKMEALITAYRRHHQQQCHRKTQVLSYQFLSNVYDHPRSTTRLARSAFELEPDLRVRQLLVGSDEIFETAYLRLSTVSTTETATWWYIFWDDFWRRNYDTISKLRLHEVDFNPYYPTSIAYTPLPRPILESFLIQRGLLSMPSKRKEFLHSGFLNKLYLRLNETAFHGSSKIILFHLGDDKSELDMDGIDLEIQTEGLSSMLGTGGGTDHDDSSIIVRPEYKWEGVLTDTLQHHRWRRKEFFSKLGAWFGITPLWRAGAISPGVAIDARLENGRYVLLDDVHSSPK
ncbi:hypothetical protein J3R30DRAFT_3443672 [Lentinula aciculospora]|uniref:Uncharacterized protein n=1 Tax=Lentinula aciculospora TaxID=153920 RepID=A0A9W9DUQ5_9AGAR|nr:hypothetical protein J3R30DRAFT_3443672 [Lentinula aciculospora]